MKLSGLAAGLLLLIFGSGARAGEDYFLLMFGSQRVPNDPNYSHSFATFVRASWLGDSPCPVNPCLETVTISWLPCNMKVRTWALCPEEGRNFDLHTTIRWCLDNQMRISLWGAYRIDPDLYFRAQKQAALLESGQVQYKAVDMGYPTDRASNCIHAIGSIANGYRIRVATPGWGESASYVILQRLEPWIYHIGCTHPWVGSALGLDQYPIIYRDYRRPLSGGVVGPFFRLFGSERDLQATYGPPVR